MKPDQGLSGSGLWAARLLWLLWRMTVLALVAVSAASALLFVLALFVPLRSDGCGRPQSASLKKFASVVQSFMYLQSGFKNHDVQNRSWT